VEQVLATAVMSTVNWCEVLQKLRARAIDEKAVYKNLVVLGLQIIPFGLGHAEKAGELWHITAPLGLSLDDRACLATGLIENLPIMTADQTWQKLPLTVDIQMIR
jgi:ribonuclease VapC